MARALTVECFELTATSGWYQFWGKTNLRNWDRGTEEAAEPKEMTVLLQLTL